MDTRTLAMVLSTLAQLGGARQRRSAARTIAIEIACAVAAAAAAAAAIGCAAVALWSFALPSLGPVGTPLLVAGAFLLVCAIALLVIAQLRGGHREAPDPAQYAEAIGDQLAKALPTIAEFKRLAQDNAGTLAIAALVAGIVAGSSGAFRGRR